MLHLHLRDAGSLARCSANQDTQMYMYQGAVSGEDVYIREGMAALAGWQGGACTASS